MHRCEAKCCDNTELTVAGVMRCMTECQVDMKAANSFMGRQIENLQSRLERCAMDCQDKVKDKMSSDGIKDQPTDSQMESYRGRYEECVHKCVDSHVHMMQGMGKKIKDAIKNKSYNIDTV